MVWPDRLLAYFIVTALVAIPNVPSWLWYTFLDMKYSLDRMVTLMGCFQFTADMGSLEFSNQETEYKLRRGTQVSNSLLVIQGSFLSNLLKDKQVAWL